MSRVVALLGLAQTFAIALAYIFAFFLASLAAGVALRW